MRRLFCTLAVLAAAGGALAAPAWAEAYVNDEEGFSIDFPASWQSRENTMGMVVIGLAPLEDAKDQFSENVNVVTETLPGPMSLADYTDLSIQGLKQQLTKVKVYERKTVQLGDRPATRIVYSHEYGGVPIKAVVYCVLTDARAYVVTCTAENGKYGKYVKQFDAIAGTFAVTEAAGAEHAPEEGEAPPEE